jgi:hypothetical protein
VDVVRMLRRVWGRGGLLSYFGIESLEPPGCETVLESCARSSVPYQHQLLVMTQPELPAAVYGSQLKIAAPNRCVICCQHIDIVMLSLDVVYMTLV